MKRYGLKWRVNTYQETQFYRLAMIGRKAVAPGEKLSKLFADVRMVSEVYDKMLLNPMLVQLWAFYVPYRLVWDQWVDFIAQDDAVTSVPTTTTPAPQWFDGAGVTPRSALPRRAYKLIYNQYFGDDQYKTENPSSDTWFGVDADTETASGQLLIWDQFRSHLKERAYLSQKYIAAVTGSDATIVLDDLSRALRDNRARRRQKMTGDKYVDTMRRMGVELDWRVQMAPEFLGSSQQVIWPHERQSTTPDVTGNDTQGLQLRGCCYEAQTQFALKRPVMFAEHGIVVVLAGLRPMVSLVNAALDSQQTTIARFFQPDTASGPMETAGAGGALYERNGLYLRGQNMVGLTNLSYVLTDTGNVQTVYPTVVMQTAGGPPAQTTVAMLTDLSIGGLTPVPSGRA